MSIFVEFQLVGQPKVKKKLDGQDIKQPVGDFISAFLTLENIPPRTFLVAFQGSILPEETTLEENGIIGKGETLRLYQDRVPA
jgi:sulfur carrier protein ThiS